jgi:hypothetical protein
MVSRGALSESDGRCLMALLDMGRYLANEISQCHKFESLADASELRARDIVATAKLTAEMYSFWFSAPAGRGVYEMLLDWTRDHSARTMKREVHGRKSQKPGFEAALHPLVKNECAQWPRQRVHGVFYYVRDAEDGASLLVDEHLRSVYKVYGISVSLGDLLRQNEQGPPACFLLTLLPFMGRIVYDGMLRGKALPPNVDQARL